MEAEQFLNAIASGDAATVRIGLPEMASVRHPGGASAVQWALYTGHSDIAEEILAAGAQVDVPTACSVGRIDAIPSDVDPDGLSPDGFRPLALAAAFGHNDIVRLLLTKGANPNLISPALGGVPPLQSAIFGRNLEAVKLLVDAGADVNGRQGGGFTAIMGAAQHGDMESVRFLLDNGADKSAVDSEGKGALDYAATDEIRILILNYPAG